MFLFFFIIITIILLMKLNSIIGMDIGFKIDVKKENDRFKDVSKDAEIREVGDRSDDGSYNSGEDYIFGTDIATSEYKGFHADLIPRDFLAKSKKAFEVIFEAYAEGDRETLRELLSPKICKAFCMAIDDRESRGEKLEGILVRFVRVDITNVATRGSDGEVLITVKFVTEQSNVLKSRSGTVIEGDSNFVQKRTDQWVFARKKDSGSATWFLQEIMDG